MKITYEDFRDWYFGQCDDAEIISAINEQLQDSSSFCSTMMWLTRGDFSQLPQDLPEALNKSLEIGNSLQSADERRDWESRAEATSKIGYPRFQPSKPARKRFESTVLHHLSKVAFGLAIVCSLAGCVPMNAKPVYFTGLTFAGLCTVYAFLTRRGRIWCFLPLLLNLAAIATWPDVIGYFPSANGNSIQIGRRIFDTDGKLTEEITFFWVSTNIKYRLNELVQLQSDEGFYTSRIFDGYDFPWAIKRFPEIQTLKLTIGNNTSETKINTSIFKRMKKNDLLQGSAFFNFSNYIPPDQNTTWAEFVVEQSVFNNSSIIYLQLDDELNTFFNKPKKHQLVVVVKSRPGFHTLNIRDMHSKSLLSEKIWLDPLGPLGSHVRLNKFNIQLNGENEIDRVMLKPQKF